MRQIQQRHNKAVEKCLNRNLKKTAPYDNRIIQTAMYSYMSNTSQEMFDYDDMLKRFYRVCS